MNKIIKSLALSIFFCVTTIANNHGLANSLDDLILALRKTAKQINDNNYARKNLEYIDNKYDFNLPNDVYFGKNHLQFELKREHRILDTIARLLQNRLADKQPGSVSLAWINGNRGLQLVISTKRTLHKKHILSALHKIDTKSNYFSNTVAGNLTEYISYKKSYIKTILTDMIKCDDENKINSVMKKNYFKARKEIDLIKFYLSRYNSPYNNKYNQKIATFFSDINREKIIILNNSTGLHSELRIVEFLLENNANLGFINDSFGNKIPYQYIGSSLKSCAKCYALIDGDRTDGYKKIISLNDIADNMHIAVFMRGFYEYSYPNFFIPRWAMKINKTKYLTEFKDELDSVTLQPSAFNISELFVEKIADLSSSDDEI